MRAVASGLPSGFSRGWSLRARLWDWHTLRACASGLPSGFSRGWSLRARALGFRLTLLSLWARYAQERKPEILKPCARSCPALLQPSVSPAAWCSGVPIPEPARVRAQPSFSPQSAQPLGAQVGTHQQTHTPPQTTPKPKAGRQAHPTQGRQGRRKAAKGNQIRKPPQAQSKMEASAKSRYPKSKPNIVYIGRI